MHSISDLMQVLTAEHPVATEHFCEDCNAVVPGRRMRCPACQVKRIAEDRRIVLQSALQSLPNMPWARWGGSWAKVCARPIYDAVRTWERGSGNLVLLGPTGCGKTTAVVARVRGMIELAANGRVDRARFEFAAGIRFATALSLAKDRKRWPLGAGEAPDVEEAMDATLLVLDELGFEMQDDTAVPEIVEYRYRTHRPTITTSGLREDELVVRYGDATTRKLLGYGNAIEAFE